MKHKLYKGDCLEIMKNIKNKIIINMKKLFKFKKTLEKIEKLGFKLAYQTEVNNHMLEMYERYDKTYKFNQIVYISKKSSTNKWYIQSYEDNCNSDGFNNCVALTEEEMKLFLKRIKEIK